ncbi:MAG: hypothetical protein SFW67_08295 [Myxococcaceae bacterium]|nr:hypothetical protein [Myxococcaceae bacterium]
MLHLGTRAFELLHQGVVSLFGHVTTSVEVFRLGLGPLQASLRVFQESSQLDFVIHGADLYDGTPLVIARACQALPDVVFIWKRRVNRRTGSNTPRCRRT